MTTSERRVRLLLHEGRALQRYACSDGAPPLALRRYVRLLGPGAQPLPVLRRCWGVRWFPVLIEPVPFLEPSEAGAEVARRLHLVMTVTELTPWAAARDRAVARRGIAVMLARAVIFAAVELAAFPLRVVLQSAFLGRGASRRER